MPSGSTNPERRPTIGFVVSRLGGHDGVSLEVMHWVRILKRAGHRIEAFTGRVETSPQLEELTAGSSANLGVTVDPVADPEAPRRAEMFDRLFDPDRRDRDPAGPEGVLTTMVELEAAALQEAVGRWVDQRGVEVLFCENFTLPWHHLPLGLAAARLARTRDLPVVHRGHDFPDDRESLYHWKEAHPAVRACADEVYASGPRTTFIAINSRDRDLYFARRGIRGVIVVPNTIDVESDELGRETSSERRDELRAALFTSDRSGPGRAPDRMFIAIAPVRPVRRKRLDVALRLLKRLSLRPGAPAVALVVTHPTTDARAADLDRLRRLAAEPPAVPLVFAEEVLRAQEVLGHADGLESRRGEVDVFELYAAGDLALYFSDFEGYGNALLEVLAAGLPTFVNRYEIYQRDIEPAGFDLDSVTLAPGAPFDAPGEAALDVELDRLAASVHQLLEGRGRPGGALDARWGARIETNRAILKRNNSYASTLKLLVEAIDRAIYGA